MSTGSINTHKMNDRNRGLDGASGGVASAARELSREGNDRAQQRHYWCHTCQTEVNTRVVEDTCEVECTRCGNSFVEEVETGEAHPSSYSSANAQERIRQENEGFGGISQFVQQLFRSFNRDGVRDPMTFFIQHGNVAPGAGVFSFGAELASNPGDYHFGSGAALDALLNQLMQADNSRGAPPASKAFVDALPKIKLTQEEELRKRDCAVCKDLLQIGVEYTELPCKHLFCGDCITPWLKEHNSCPVCRHELPTDDAEYERARKARRTNESASEEVE